MHAGSIEQRKRRKKQLAWDSARPVHAIFFSFCKRKAGKTVSILCRARASLTHRSSRAFWNDKQSVVVNVTRHAYIISRPFHKYLLIITAFNKTLAPYLLCGSWRFLSPTYVQYVRTQYSPCPILQGSNTSAASIGLHACPSPCVFHQEIKTPSMHVT